MDKIDNMNKATKLLDTAIKTITLIKFYENYMATNGRLSWETYKEKIAQAPISTTPRNQFLAVVESVFFTCPQN